MAHLKEDDIKNTVFAPIRNNLDVKQSDDDNVYVKKCFNNADRLNYHHKQKKIYTELKKTLSLSDFDLVHAYTVFTDGGIAYKLKKDYGIPYIVAVRNTDLNVFLKYIIYLRKYGIEILKNAEKVIFLSSAYKERVMRYIPDKDKENIEKKSLIIPNGIDDFWYENVCMSAKSINTSKINICYAGIINRNKICRLTIKACDALIKEGYDIGYTIVGKMADIKTKAMIKKRPYITYMPPMKKEELIKIYRENDIFVMPSKTETFGLAYAEAMSQGLPVIYTKNEGFDMQFQEGVVGYHTSAKNPQELAMVIKKVIYNYDDIAPNTIVKVNAFKWDDIAKKYITIYQQII